MFKEFDILRLFFEESGREFNVREVARILKIAPATASKNLKSFVKFGVLTWRKERNLDLYRADVSNDFYRDLKVFYNIRKIKDSGLLDALNRFYLKPTVVFFGSAARGVDVDTSDFDLLVVSENAKVFSAKEFERKIGRNVHLVVVHDISKIGNNHLLNNILNGVTLQGGLKWI